MSSNGCVILLQNIAYASPGSHSLYTHFTVAVDTEEIRHKVLYSFRDVIQRNDLCQYELARFQII